MTFGFLFWLFLVGLIIASSQDLKRREVDDWLNLFLIISSFSFILLRVIFESNVSLIFQLILSLIVLFLLMNAFYYGHVFAGGDAKLLFAMAALFAGVSFTETMINIGLFVLFLMISGSIYGLVYSLFLYFKNFKQVNAGIKREFGGLWVRVSLFSGVVLLALSFFNLYILFLTLFAFVFPLLYIFARGLEEVSMVKDIPGKDLCEGDWLAKDVKVKGRLIKANWEGLSLGEIELMENLKKVKIKQGLPFVPAFLIAFILYFFFKDFVLGSIIMGS